MAVSAHILGGVDRFRTTYREPASYHVQYFDGTAWVDAPGQVRTPSTSLPNYNEIQVFDTGRRPASRAASSLAGGAP
jgi:hypothetical protein